MGIRSYAAELASQDLEGNRSQIENMRKLSENMASYHCMEVYEKSCDDRIREKYQRPFDDILQGKDIGAASLDDVNTIDMYDGLSLYKEELEQEGCDEVMA